MKFSLNTPGGVNLITHYRAGAVVVDGQTLTRSFVVAPDSLIEEWRPQTFAELTGQDLEEVVALEPEVALLGTGEKQQFLPPHLLAAFATRGIGLEVMTTAAACRTYNIIRAEDRRVVAAIVFA